jgi:hypothetical protein
MRLRSSPLHPAEGSHLARALELDPEQRRPTVGGSLRRIGARARASGFTPSDSQDRQRRWFTAYTMRALGSRVRARRQSLAVLLYVAGPHVLVDELVPRHLGNGFGLLSPIHRDPLAHEFDGTFFIGLVYKEIALDTRFPVGIEGGHSDIPACRHFGTMRRICPPQQAGSACY